MASGISSEIAFQSSAPNTPQTCIANIENTRGILFIHIDAGNVAATAQGAIVIEDEETGYVYTPTSSFGIGDYGTVYALEENGSNRSRFANGAGTGVGPGQIMKCLSPRPNRISVTVGALGVGVISNIRIWTERN